MKAKELTELGQWKVGMAVIIHDHLHCSVHKISRITDGREGTIYGREGTIYVPVSDCATSVFDSLGNLRTSDPWTHCTIEPMTPEKRKEIEMNIRQNKLNRFDISSLTPTQASEIVLFMREKGIKI